MRKFIVNIVLITLALCVCMWVGFAALSMYVGLGARIMCIDIIIMVCLMGAWVEQVGKILAYTPPTTQGKAHTHQ